MRNGIEVFDCDTHLRPTVETIIPYLEPELRKQAHQWRKVPVRIGMAGERYQPPHPALFSFSHPQRRMEQRIHAHVGSSGRA